MTLFSGTENECTGVMITARMLRLSKFLMYPLKQYFIPKIKLLLITLISFQASKTFIWKVFFFFFTYESQETF